MANLDSLLICGIILGATTVRSTLGFGEALIAMPLLVLIVPVQFAAPLVALVSVLNALAILVWEWRSVSFSETMWLTVSALVAIPFGGLLLNYGSELIVTGLLAFVVLAFSLWSLFSAEALELKSDRSAVLFGVTAGILGGAYNTPGPPLVMFGTLRRWPPARFRANLQGYFLVSSAAILTMHFFNGRVTERVLVHFGLCLPLVLLAAYLGRRISRNFDRDRFLRIVHVALAVLGVVLLTKVLVRL